MPNSHTNIFATGPSGIRDSIDFAENLRDDSFSDNTSPGDELTRDEKIVAALRKTLLFRKLAMFAKVYESDEIVSRLPIFALAKISLVTREPGDNTIQVKKSLAFPLGSLATDHVGYASFDLRPLQDIGFLLTLSRSVPDDIPIKDVGLNVEYLLLPFAEDQFAIDAIEKGDVSTENIVVRLHLEASWLVGREDDPALPSMQNPDIQDWRYSPGSFAISPSRLIGDDACEDLYPSDLSSHQFAFHQAVQVGSPEGIKRNENITSVRYGYLLDFRTQWFPVGHSLGRILYSLPLAPGEKVKLAIIDWSRTDSASRTEGTSASEELVSDQNRDRVIGEIVRSSIREKQSGHSVMGGTGSSVVVPAGGAIIGGSLGLGGSKKSSKGFRKIAADTTQNLSDGFHQASTAVRELNSTVITQISQSEQGRFETRQVANHNHCHTLTILYYEVLRHYRTVTSFVRRRPVLFVEFAKALSIDVTIEENALAYRAAIEPALLDSRYLAGFDALNRVTAAKLKLAQETDRLAGLDQPLEQANWVFNQFTAMFHTGDDGHDKHTRFSLVKKNGDIIPCRQIHPARGGDTTILDTPDLNEWRENSLDAFVVVPEVAIKWGDISLARIDFQVLPTIDSGTWQLDKFDLIATTSEGGSARLISNDVNHFFNGPSNLSIPVTGPTHGSQDLPPILTDHVSEDDIAASNRLLQHLGKFSDYYGAIAFASSDPVKRSEHLKSAKLGSLSIGELVENQVVASEGLNLAFPLTNEAFAREQLRIDEEDENLFVSGISVEDLISVPTKGVFADGKLGHCSTCEKIDNSRFWDFQKSPIPGDAPEISPVSTDSRFQAPQNLTPTDFPSSLVSMATPPTAPDPVAMATALKILGSGDIFRDMSGGADLAKFLTSVVQGTQGMVNAMGGNKRQSDLLDKIMNNPDLNSEEKTKLASDLLNNGGAGKSDEKAGSKTNPLADKKSNSASTDKSDKDSQPKTLGAPVRATKPELAKTEEDLIGFRVDTDTQTIPYENFKSEITIYPEGQTPYLINRANIIASADGETEIIRGENAFYSGFFLRKGSSRTGNIDIRIQLIASAEIRGFSDQPGLAELIKANLVNEVYGFMLAYSFPEGENLNLKVRFHFETKLVGGETWSAAKTEWEQETDALTFRKIVSVFATDFSDGEEPADPGDRSWLIGYLAGKPTISVGPME